MGEHAMSKGHLVTSKGTAWVFVADGAAEDEALEWAYMAVEGDFNDTLRDAPAAAPPDHHRAWRVAGRGSKSREIKFEHATPHWVRARRAAPSVVGEGIAEHAEVEAVGKTIIVFPGMVFSGYATNPKVLAPHSEGCIPVMFRVYGWGSAVWIAEPYPYDSNAVYCEIDAGEAGKAYLGAPYAYNSSDGTNPDQIRPDANGSGTCYSMYLCPDKMTRLGSVGDLLSVEQISTVMTRLRARPADSRVPQDVNAELYFEYVGFDLYVNPRCALIHRGQAREDMAMCLPDGGAYDGETSIVQQPAGTVLPTDETPTSLTDDTDVFRIVNNYDQERTFVELAVELNDNAGGQWSWTYLEVTIDKVSRERGFATYYELEGRNPDAAFLRTPHGGMSPREELKVATRRRCLVADTDTDVSVDVFGRTLLGISTAHVSLAGYNPIASDGPPGWMVPVGATAGAAGSIVAIIPGASLAGPAGWVAAGLILSGLVVVLIAESYDSTLPDCHATGTILSSSAVFRPDGKAISDMHIGPPMKFEKDMVKERIEGPTYAKSWDTNVGDVIRVSQVYKLYALLAEEEDDRAYIEVNRYGYDKALKVEVR